MKRQLDFEVVAHEACWKEKCKKKIKKITPVEKTKEDVF